MTIGHFSIMNKFFKFEKRLQYSGARRTRAAHHHGSDTPTSPRAVLHHTDANLCTILHTTVYPKMLKTDFIFRQQKIEFKPECWG
jgi:hypothetical protein